MRAALTVPGSKRMAFKSSLHHDGDYAKYRQNHANLYR